MIVPKNPYLDLAAIADSGQCFRWQRREDGYVIPALGRVLRVRETPDGALELSCMEEEYRLLWRGYFDLDADYGAMAAVIPKEDAYLRAAASYQTLCDGETTVLIHGRTGDESLQLSVKDNKVSVVYNGYDAAQFYPQDIPAKQFTVSYIGSLFEWQQAGLTQVRQAIDELGLPIQLELHTPTHNALAHNTLGDAIRRSSILLVLTSERTHGMLTTKFYEALGCEKPVLCVPSDKGSLAELIAYTNAGIATDDIEAIKAFIRARYEEWQQKGFTRQATQHRETFAREAQYDQYYSTHL